MVRGNNLEAEDSAVQKPLSWALFPYAAEGGHHTIVELHLKTRKVDPDSKDSSGRTPLSFAVR